MPSILCISFNLENFPGFVNFKCLVYTLSIVNFVPEDENTWIFGDAEVP